MTDAMDSNLSHSNYLYDMVVGVTQKSVNETMRSFLSKASREPFTMIWVEEEQGDTFVYVPGDYEAIKKTLGFDPFTVPGDVSLSDPRLEKMYDNYVAFGFQAEVGFPDFPDTPDPIYFDKPGTSVTYNQVFKDFKVFSLQEKRRRFVWKHFKQSDPSVKEPLVFKYEVDLDLRTSNVQNKFKDLPQETQDQIKNMGPNMFSVQQLFLDLNVASLQKSEPQAVGLSAEDEALQFLNTVFLGSYMATFDPNGNGVMLGFAVTASRPLGVQASLIPTNFTFYISPYKNVDGTNSTEYDLYTLNYLIMSDGRKLPIPREFDWNWVSGSEVLKYHGACAVRRGVFVSYLKTILSPSLSSICLTPSVDVDIDNPFTMKFSWNAVRNFDKQLYEESDEGTKVLTFSYHKRAYDSDTFVPLWGNMGLDCYASSDIFFEGNIIRIVSNARVYGKVNIEGGVTKGNIVNYTTTTKYQLGVESNGKIYVTPSSPKFEDTSDNIDPNDWSQFVTFGTVDDFVDKIKGSLAAIKTFLTGFDKQIYQRLNGPTSWVFPGGNTFKFMDANFSEHQDMVSHLKYLDV